MRIPLVRTEGKVFTGGRRVTVDTLFEPDASLQCGYRSDMARAAEEGLSLGASLYFYVGFACSAFVEWSGATIRSAFVLLYDPAIVTESESGGHTKFDSGGLWHGYTQFDPARTIEQCRDWGRTDAGLNTLANWRANVDAYVQDHFDGDEPSYVRELHPRARDTEGLGRMTHAQNDRRAWNYEVRVHRDHRLREGLLSIVARTDALEALRNRLENTEDDGTLAALRSALRRGRSLGAAPDEFAFATVVREAICEAM
jgi:hypothetical protein